MSLPSSNALGQPSIRNFFRPKLPTYAPPPSAAKGTKTATPPPPPPPLPAATTAAAATINSPQSEKRTPPPPANGSLPLRPKNLHPQASISRIQPEHIPALRRITSLLLPVNYPDSFYARLSDPLSSGAFSRVILWRDGQGKEGKDGEGAPAKVIGGLVCRPEPTPFHCGTVDNNTPLSAYQQRARTPVPTMPSAQPNALYIQSLVLLSPYRGLGLAASLLEEVVADAAQSEFACETVWAHVWTQNEEGLRWYTARGFTCTEEVKGYYSKLQPDSAWIVRLDIGPGALLGINSHNDRNKESVDEAGSDTTRLSRESVTAAAANLSSTSTHSRPRPPPSSKAVSLPATAPPSSYPSPSLPPTNGGGGSGRSTPGQSFQNMRPETEWNDLPPDMQIPLPAGTNNSNNTNGSKLSVLGTGSAGSSRSSSAAARRKRDRAYPAAAFGPS